MILHDVVNNYIVKPIYIYIYVCITYIHLDIICIMYHTYVYIYIHIYIYLYVHTAYDTHCDILNIWIYYMNMYHICIDLSTLPNPGATVPRGQRAFSMAVLDSMSTVRQCSRIIPSSDFILVQQPQKDR